MTSDLLLISLSLFTWGVGEGMFFYIQPLYLKDLGASTLGIGTILGIAGLAMMVAHIPAGYLADRIGRRPLLVAAWIFGVGSAWVMALARSLPVFVLGMVLYNMTAFVSSPLSSYVTAARGKLPVRRALTLTSAAYNLGAVLGPFSGGLVSDHFGRRTVYLAAACVFVLSAFVIFFLRAQPRDGHDPAEPPLNLFSNRHYLAFLGVAFFAMFAMSLPQPLTTYFLQNEHGLTDIDIGKLGSLGSLGNALLNLALGHLNIRLGFMISQVLVGVFAFLLWRQQGFGWYALGYFLLGGFRAARMLAAAQIRPLVHQAQMGLAYGVNETLNSFAVALAPPLASLLYQRDPVSIYPLSIILISISLLVFFLFAPRESVISD